jgi:glutathione S-transferase
MLKLHHAPNSRAGRIVWLLEELQLPYALNRMDFHPSALKSDECLERRRRLAGIL